MTEPQEPLLTSNDVFTYIAEQLHVHPNTARRYARDSHTPLPYARLPGGGRRYTMTDAQAFVEAIRATSKAATQ